MEPDTKVKLLPVNRFNWEQCIHLEVDDDQQGFIPQNVHSIAQSKFEPCEPYGVYVAEELVGFVMICVWSGVAWITRLMIDRQFQGKGYGRRALEAAMALIRQNPDLREVRVTVSRTNALAEYIFQSAGFLRGEAIDDREFVMRLELK